MTKRPLCQVAVFVVVLLVLIQQFLPDMLRQKQIPAKDGETVTICGRIYDRQEKNNTIQISLKDVIILKSGEISKDTDISKNSDASSASSEDSGAMVPGRFSITCIAYCNSNSQETDTRKTDSKKTENMQSQKECYAIGSTVELSGIMSFFEDASNPGQFDAASYYRSMGIDFAVFRAEVEQSDGKKDRLKEGLYTLREKIHTILDDLAGEQASILQAMLLGEKSQMNPDIKALYQKNGISHILVISGLHFSLLGKSLYKGLRKAGLPFGAAGGLCVMVLFLYGVMTGFGVSAIRAFLMFVLFMGAEITGRSYDMPTSLATAVLCLVGANPYVLTQTGFLLSAGAILGLIVIQPVMDRLYPVREIEKKLDPGKKIASGIRSGVAIQLVTFPVLLYSFFEFSPWSILLNCLVLPLVPVVLLGAVGGVIVSPLGHILAKLVILPSLAVLKGYEGLCRVAERLPKAVVVTGQPPLWCILVYYAGLLFLILAVWYGKQGCGRWKRILISACMGLLVGFLIFPKEQSGMEISMLDVGQGQCIYIRCQNRAVLYDGGSTDVSDVGTYRMVPFLKAKGVSCLELVVVSHLDEDHYNGIKEILEENLLEIRCLMLPVAAKEEEKGQELAELAEAMGADVRWAEKGDTFEVGETTFEVLHPDVSYAGNDRNDASMVLFMEYGEFSMLFTGDVEQSGEKKMLSDGVLRKVDVLQVAHHGSDSSSSEAFLTEVAPEMAWISCGEDNSYGHPHESVIERLEKQQCKLYRTDRQGCITLSPE